MALCVVLQDRSGLGFGGATGALDHRMQRRGRLGALGQPVIHAVELDGHGVALGPRIVGAELFDGIAIAAGTGLGDDHAVVRFVLGAEA
jgi:hypothetical protein